MNEQQHIILRKLKTYKTPRTARQLFDVLSPKHPGKFNNIQQMNANLSALWDANHIVGSHGQFPRTYTAR